MIVELTPPLFIVYCKVDTLYTTSAQQICHSNFVTFVQIYFALSKGACENEQICQIDEQIHHESHGEHRIET
jgi:hypothetical protein